MAHIKSYENDGQCPKCGYCKACGRSNSQYPQMQWTYTQPYWVSTTETAQTSTVTYPINTTTAAGPTTGTLTRTGYAQVVEPECDHSTDDTV